MKFSRLSVATVAALASLSLAACTSEAPAGRTPTEQGIGAPVDAPRITLVTQGGEERTQLRYSDVDAAEQQVTLDVSEGFEQRVEHAASVDPVPPENFVGSGEHITLPLTGSTDAASEASEGQQEATRAPEFRVGDLERTSLKSASGFRMGWRGDDQGRVSTVMFSAPPEATDQARASVEKALLSTMGVLPVFPEEEVGVGATWGVDVRVPGDANLLQSSTYVMRELNGNRAVLDVSIERRPSLGALNVTGVEGEAGEELKVASTQSWSKGTIVVDLSQALPVNADIKTTTRVVYAGSQPQQVVQDSSLAVKLN
ncbi:hypothetical protein [Corynebacterium tapiri]|uniref:Secreted protein n=1 Tax=Corynebacterium tapiri TaxID=1448266 RepID=A0A5C4U5C6_9CORY|nr:hypothetical protein [Corynebacterium tapiri]TNL99386.1 hypothetical protein FHE74_03255 [Corynebacterium tapiri]